MKESETNIFAKLLAWIIWLRKIRVQFYEKRN